MSILRSSRLSRAADTLVSKQFAIASNESVLITADNRAEQSLLSAVFESVTRAEAKPAIMLIPRLPLQGRLADPYISDTLRAAAQSSDVWLDFCFPYLAGSDAHEGAMQSNRCRYALLSTSNSDSFERLYSGVDYDALLDFNIAFMEFVRAAAGKTARFTCPAGTDVSFTLDSMKLARSRVCNKPGMDTIPGTQSLYPVLESVKGKIVIQCLFDEDYRQLRIPIEITVDGKIMALSGGGIEDRLSFERALKRASGTDKYGYFIHFTFGFHPGTKHTGQHFIEDIRLPGSNAIGMGLPWWQPGGGENHPDGVLFDQSLWIDDIQISDRGAFVGPDHLKRLHDRLIRRLD